MLKSLEIFTGLKTFLRNILVEIIIINQTFFIFNDWLTYFIIYDIIYRKKERGIGVYMEEEVIDNVSNTYLVLRKMKEEYSSLLGKISDSKFNNKLISILKNICTVNFINDAFTKTIDELKEFKDFSICQEVYYSSKLKKRFNLLLLEKDRQRILLNYLESPKNFESVEENYIPDTWLKCEYSSSLEKKHGKYTVINTFDSLLSFAKLNKLTKISEVNRIFF